MFRFRMSRRRREMYIGHSRLCVCDTADCVLPSTRTKFGECDFCYLGLAAWNGLTSVTLTHSKSGSRACYLIMFFSDLYGTYGRCVERRPANFMLNVNLNDIASAILL